MNIPFILFRDLKRNQDKNLQILQIQYVNIQMLHLWMKQKKKGIFTIIWEMKEKENKLKLTGIASPYRVIKRSVLSSGSFATSNEHLLLANRSCKKKKEVSK